MGARPKLAKPVNQFGIEVLRVYHRAIFRNPKFFSRRFLRTPYTFRKVRDLVRSCIFNNRADYAFSFQFQSLFDTSTPGLPHFIYTDHTYHESQKYSLSSTYFSPEWAALEKEIYHNASSIFTWSSNISRSLTHDYGVPEAKVVCAYTGPNLEMPAHLPDKHDYSHQNILFVGSDWERKGGPVLAAAFKLVLEALPEAHLTVIGPAPHIDLPNSQFLGRLPIDELEEYFRRATVFCLPTRREPFGNVFIDAMQAALPIVATNVEALPDVVTNGENGYLVEPDDVHALAKALIELLSEPEKCRRFGARSHSLCKTRYNWDNVGVIMRDTIMRGSDG
jgi:glycosyltransferase involved in cell wall biosynthesis